MVRIFDLPPGGLVDGSAAQEVDAQGKPINKNELVLLEKNIKIFYKSSFNHLLAN